MNKTENQPEKDESLDNQNLKTRIVVDNIIKSRKMFIREISHHTKTVNKAIFNSSGTIFATCGNDNMVFLYNSITYDLINKYKVSSAAKHIIFMKKQDKIMVGTALGHFYIFDIFCYQENQTFFEHENTEIRLLSMDLSYGDNYLAMISKKMFGDNDGKRNCLKVYKTENFVVDDLNTFFQEEVKIEADEEDFTCVKYGLKENIVYLARSDCYLFRYDLEKTTKYSQDQVTCYLEDIKSITFSPRYEFLLLNCFAGVGILDPNNLSVFKIIKTKYPVLSSQISPFMYNKTNPMYHLILAGGIPARDQAMKSDGGNEIFFYNFATSKKITQLGGCYGNVNWISLFNDGSGLITASEEGISRIYRFDKCYYDDEMFK